MSTRATITFAYHDGTPAACIYRHCDGYPDGLLPDLDAFFAQVEADTDDTRFTDAPYLAAKFVAWQAAQNNAFEKKYARPGQKCGPLNFLSLGIIPIGADYGAEYRYTVTATEKRNARPRVTYAKV